MKGCNSTMKQSRISAEEAAYLYIKNKIINKELRPAEQIVEMDVADASGISRTSIRSAIRRLGYEGLLVVRPNRGAYVANPSLEELRDIFACKRLLETEAIRLASHQITQIQLQQMEQLVNKSPQSFYEKNFSAFLALNKEFHMIIAQASQNLCYIKYIDELLTKSNVFLIFYDDFMLTSFDESDAHKEHCSILSALQQKNENLCVDEMRRHSDSTYESLIIH